MEPIIKIDKLSVVYFLGRSNEVRALQNISLEIYPGEFIIFFGPSGCGKSTLLYLIAGLENATDGHIFINGKNLAGLSQKELEKFHRQEIGMIFQAYYLINSLSVIDNILLPQIFMNSRPAERKKKAAELLEHFGVGSQAKKLPNELSGGQQQRVAICRSLINDPAVILADEPVGNLDSVSAEEVIRLISELNEKQKKTIILVTHNPAHLNFAHRVFYMKDGTIIETKVNRVIDRSIAPLIKEPSVALSRDMELLLRTYSSLSPNQVGNLLIPFKAKQVVSEVLIGLTSEAVEEVEKKVEDLLMRGIRDPEGFFHFLDVDQQEGGLGLDSRTAKIISDKIKNIVKEIKFLEEEETRLKQGGPVKPALEVLQIRHYLMDLFQPEVKDYSSLHAIDKTIAARLSNQIDRKKVEELLDLPLAEGGAGLDKRIVRKISQRLELLILGKLK